MPQAGQPVDTETRAFEGVTRNEAHHDAAQPDSSLSPMLDADGNLRSASGDRHDTEALPMAATTSTDAHTGSNQGNNGNSTTPGAHSFAQS